MIGSGAGYLYPAKPNLSRGTGYIRLCESKGLLNNPVCICICCFT